MSAASIRRATRSIVSANRVTASTASSSPQPTTYEARDPPHRYAAFVAEFRKNDPGFLRRTLPPYLACLDRHGSVAPRLCASGVPAWVVFGEKDDIGVTADERRMLDVCQTVAFIAIPDAGHMALVEVPDRIAQIVLDGVSATAARTPVARDTNVREAL